MKSLCAARIDQLADSNKPAKMQYLVERKEIIDLALTDDEMPPPNNFLNQTQAKKQVTVVQLNFTATAMRLMSPLILQRKSLILLQHQLLHCHLNFSEGISSLREQLVIKIPGIGFCMTGCCGHMTGRSNMQMKWAKTSPAVKERQKMADLL